MIGTKVSSRLRMSASDAHYAGDLVDGGRILALFGDVATELLVRLDGDEGLFRAYESVEFLAPVFAGDFIEATAELVAIGKSSRKILFEARKYIANVRTPGLPPSAADVLFPPILVARALGTCVVPKDLQRRPPELYMPALPAGPPPGVSPIVTPVESSHVILTAAIVGAELTRAQTPHLPIKPREVADEAARCRDAGAAIIHLHARNDDGSNTQAASRFAEVIDAIRQKCDCILQPSTGGAVGMSIEERAGPLACNPEMATLNCGTINFGDDVFVNSRSDIRTMAARIRASGATPELECYEVGHIEEALSLAADGVLPTPLHFQFVLGIKGAISAREDVVHWMRSLVPAGSTWGVAAVGKSQQPMTELAMRLGGHARVGLEDNIYLTRGVLSEGSAPLVDRAAAYARSIGESPRTPRARGPCSESPGGKSMVATLTFVADTITPVRAYAALRSAAGDAASFLLESVVGGERWGRYSILGYRPKYEMTLLPDGQWVGAGGRPPPFLRSVGARDPLEAARDMFESADAMHDADGTATRFAQAYVGYLAWDLVHAIEKVPGWGSRGTTPLGRFFGGSTIVVFDSLSHTVTIAADDVADVDRARAHLEQPAPLTPLALPDGTSVLAGVEVDLDDASYEAKVRRAQEYIAAGDAFQIVVARTFRVPRAGRDPFDVYRAMRVLNPSPYMYFLDLPPAPGERTRTQIAGASPETMVHLENGMMTLRPIAGTTRRGKTDKEDATLERDLLADPKERAEHVMLIDLGRNDVGRVAEIGSVKVVRQMEVERYSHVMHIVSEVNGRVPTSTPPLEVVRAAFPAGTLSGAPKVRAMQIIRELEAGPRGIYGGAIGYVGKTGDLDFAIAIRTAVCRDDAFFVTAGAGIVEASDPAKEAEETRSKARSALCAIETAGR